MTPSLVIFLTVFGFAHCAEEVEPSEKPKGLSNSIAHLANKLYKDLAQDSVNTVYSPASIHLALSMAYLGARKTTALEIYSALQLKNIVKQLHYLHQTWVKDVISQNEVRVDIANSLWYNDKFAIDPEYKDNLREKYLATVEELDFSSQNPEQPINDWVANKTENNIQEIIGNDELNIDSTVLVLLNAIYFQGVWDQPFDQSRTLKNQDFTRPDGTKVKVEMMTLEGRFKITELDFLNAKALKLYFRGRRFSLNFVVPNSASGFTDIEEKIINDNHLACIFVGTKEREYEIRVPKFKVAASFDMTKPLKNLGINDVFSYTADFSGISSDPVKISKFVHEAAIEVQESGTVAAAVTSFQLTSRSRKPRFDLNRAFVFYLVDEKRRIILFSGKVTDPS